MWGGGVTLHNYVHGELGKKFRSELIGIEALGVWKDDHHARVEIINSE